MKKLSRFYKNVIKRKALRDKTDSKVKIKLDKGLLHLFIHCFIIIISFFYSLKKKMKKQFFFTFLNMLVEQHNFCDFKMKI